MLKVRARKTKKRAFHGNRFTTSKRRDDDCKQNDVQCKQKDIDEITTASSSIGYIG